MLYLLLSIFCSASLIFIFKLYERYNVHTMQAIAVNYGVCVLVGLCFPGGADVLQPEIFSRTWAYYAMALGFIFIVTFYLIAVTAQKVGVTVASVAAKISLVIPVLFSLLVLQTTVKEYTWLNYTGMAAALVAIVLSSLRPRQQEAGEAGTRVPLVLAVVLPLVIFLNSGVADSLINYTNQHHLQPHEASQFTMLTFAASAVIGGAVILYQRTRHKTSLRRRSFVAGVVLGVPNFFSIFFLIQALRYFNNDGAFFYPINNIGIILAGAAGAAILFKERLNPLNKLGLALAVLALLLISYQEIIANLF
ncbi:hypothetical protein [Pontibacter actiniarum]|uniref:EamA domain-containing protein n=1 Tax=Pontibacter actiniarum TaxID=323450 RepID=A0A1X9YM98_9BACT|nr:hypothetical protein [Pontibacter actiniarum]ARS33995.1 hypothetical protein CA264_00270 [Pontibacter actiniarum]